MARILTLQRRVLAFACDAGTSLPLNDPTVFTTVFGADIGQWLWGKLTTTKRRIGVVNSSLHEALIALIDHTSKNPATRNAILQAFDDDTQFDTHLTHATFRFRYQTLDTLTQTLVRALMDVFYKDLLKTGFPSYIHGSTGTFDRDALVKAFWDANEEMRVCPACDGARPDKIATKVYSDADHFLPQSKYPFLCLHIANLLPTCTDCNRKFKGSKDPIDLHANEPLLNSFHPYSDPAINHIEVHIRRTRGGERKLRITDAGGIDSRRVKSLNRVWKLEKRWVDRLKDSASFMIDDLRNQPRLLSRLKTTPRDSLQRRMRRVLKTKQEGIGRKQSGYLDSQYLEYAINDVTEIQYLYAEAIKP